MSTDTSPATQDDALVDLTRPTVVQAIADLVADMEAAGWRQQQYDASVWRRTRALRTSYISLETDGWVYSARMDGHGARKVARLADFRALLVEQGALSA